MNVQQMVPTSALPGEAGEPMALLEAGVLALGGDGAVRFADRRALDLLGCADGFEMERVWSELAPRLQAAGLSWKGAAGGGTCAVLAVPVPPEGERRLLFDLRRDSEGGGVLLVQEGETAAAQKADLRLASQMRSISQIAPAVAHDLRAPINAMVFNLEILKETIASGRGAEQGGQERQMRYVNVLKEELSRLHKSLEIFLAHTSPRGDQLETLDLRDLAQDLASLMVAPARKQQVQVPLPELPAAAVPITGNRYLLRQALLHLALAALAGIPRQGTLEVLLSGPEDGRALLRLAGSPGPDSPPPPAEAPPAAGFDLRPSPGGTLAQLWVAQSILAAHGGQARASSTEGATPGAPQAYEVELAVLGNSGSQKEE